MKRRNFYARQKRNYFIERIKHEIAFRESWRNKELGQISLVRYRYSFATDLLSEQFAALWPVPYRNHRVLHVPCISISFSIDACLK